MADEALALGDVGDVPLALGDAGDVPLALGDAGAADETEAVMDVPSLPELDEASILVERQYRDAANDHAANDEADAGDAMGGADLVAPLDVEEVDATVPRLWTTVHVYGVDAMRTEHLEAYFDGLGPVRLQWLHLAACNAVFPSEEAATAALAARTQGLLHTAVAVAAADDPMAARLAWHIGAPHPLSARILLRFATAADTKRKPTATELERYALLHSDLARERMRKRAGRASFVASAIPKDIADLRALLKQPRRTGSGSGSVGVGGANEPVARTTSTGKAKAPRSRHGGSGSAARQLLASAAGVPGEGLTLRGATRHTADDGLELTIPSRVRAAAAALGATASSVAAAGAEADRDGPGLSLRGPADSMDDAEPELTPHRPGSAPRSHGRWAHDLYAADDDDA